MLWLLLLILPYSAIILLAWINLGKNKAEKNQSFRLENESLPVISVIIAAKNEEANLPSLIASIQNLDYPGEKFEILIVDDHSTDATAGIIRESKGIKYLSSKGDGKKQAIATGLEQSTGELILTTDADCIIPSGWLMSHAEKFINKNADMIIGEVKAINVTGLTGFFSDIEFNSLQAITGAFALAGHPVMCNGANLGFRKEAVVNYPDAVLADRRSGDDMFLLHYMKKMNKTICWLNHEGGKVETRMHTRAGSFFWQRSRWAGKAVYYKDTLTVMIAIFTLLGNLALLTALVLLFTNTSYIAPAAGIYIVKSIPEFLLLNRYLEKPGKLKKLLAFIPLSLIYPFYALFIVILSPFSSNKW